MRNSVYKLSKKLGISNFSASRGLNFIKDGLTNLKRETILFSEQYRENPVVLILLKQETFKFYFK